MADWSNYPISKVKKVSILTGTGLVTLASGSIAIGNFVGLIDLIGEPVDGVTPNLKIGFTANASALTKPTFNVSSKFAQGSIVLMADYFAAFISVANSPNAHLAIGGNGLLNRVASDKALIFSSFNEEVQGTYRLEDTTE